MKKFLALLLVVVVLGLIYTNTHTQSRDVTTGDQAIALVKKSYPAYAEYPSNNLPPKSVEVINTPAGWRVGMYVEGSGVRGILKANCFLVSRSGIVSETGFFNGEGPALSINLSTCTPKD